MSRWFGFFLTILFGVLAGIYYGWVINPVNYVDTSPDSLRIDYKTDYVLMIAEIYQVEQDPAQATRSLARLGNQPPTEIIQEAITHAQQTAYAESDQRILTDLQSGLQTWNASSEE